MAPRYTSADALLQNVKRGILDPNRLHARVHNSRVYVYLVPEGCTELDLDTADEIAALDPDTFFFSLMAIMGIQARRV